MVISTVSWWSYLLIKFFYIVLLGGKCKPGNLVRVDACISYILVVILAVINVVNIVN